MTIPHPHALASGDKYFLLITGHITRACGPGQERRICQTLAIFLPCSCTALGKLSAFLCLGSTAAKGRAKLFPYFRKVEVALRCHGAGLNYVPSGEEESRYLLGSGLAWPVTLLKAGPHLLQRSGSPKGRKPRRKGHRKPSPE